MSLTVCCLKVGTKYGPAYVERLQSMVSNNLRVRHRFVCVTDDPTGIPDRFPVSPYGSVDWMTTAASTLPLKDPQLPGWWSKLQFFHPSGAFQQIKGCVLFLDLDVIITGPLDDLVNFPSDFCMMHDLQRPWRPASAVMLLEAGSRPWIWEHFAKNADQVMREYHGDQDFIRVIMEAAGRWPSDHNREHCDFFPQRWIASYKHHAVNGPPKDCRIVCFHGVPRPHEIKTGWTIEAWK